ncbi:MAG TPA: hypothetical protein VIO64_10120, partial [Pseudobacteroides sp.]|uniref:hypothetical protein n=1 Tax=Pseudobacteroides sp. TaxID=1968840 RepID=UPI002F9350EA
MNKLCKIILLLFFLFESKSYAYDISFTHKSLTEKSVDISEINNIIINSLGIFKGLDEVINGYNLKDIITKGSVDEDNKVRAYNHFHNPLPEINAGLDDNISIANLFFDFSGQSTVDWAFGETICNSEDPSNDGVCNDYTWGRAREYYYKALTADNDFDRLDSFSKSFERFGRVLHLLEDMSVPAHTRNDMQGHLSFIKFSWKKQMNQNTWDEFKRVLLENVKDWGGNLYEYYLLDEFKSERKTLSDFLPKKDEEIKNNIPKFSKPQDYWDRNVYMRGNNPNPDSTLLVNGKEQAGLSEISNANFFSMNTIFKEGVDVKDKHWFPYPSKNGISEYQVYEVVQAKDKKIDKWTYLKKDKEGLAVDKLVAVNYFAKPLDELTDQEKAQCGPKCDPGGLYVLKTKLDNPINDYYATILLPKTVAYTAGLINYFFRGRMGIVPKFSGYDAESQMFKKVTVAATNDSKWIDDRIEPMPY